MIRARAITLIETLAALVLLSSLTVAVTSWTVSSQGLANETASRERWHSAADRIVESIREDLQVGDFALADPRPRVQSPPKVRLIERGNALAITTRAAEARGACLAVYRFERSEQSVVRELHGIEHGERLDRRTLLGDVEDVVFEATGPDDAGKTAGQITIEIVSARWGTITALVQSPSKGGQP